MILISKKVIGYLIYFRSIQMRIYAENSLLCGGNWELVLLYCV